MVPVTRYMPIDMTLLTSSSTSSASVADQWDAAIHTADTHFSQQMHNLATNNCHHHTALALQHAGLGSGWSSQVQLAVRMAVYGRWKSGGAMLCTIGPFAVIVTIVVLASVLTR